MVWTLLLPQDQSSLSERIQVLSEWVATFVSALGIAGMSTAALSQEGQEFLQDLSQIARIDAEADDVTGEELDFIEITEYVRTGVMVLFAELNASTMPSKSIN